jgi:hypothetical protein
MFSAPQNVLNIMQNIVLTEKVMTPSGRFFLSLFADIFVIGRLEECEEVFSFTNVHTAFSHVKPKTKKKSKGGQ